MIQVHYGFFYVLVFLQFCWLVDADKIAVFKRTSDWQPQGERPLTLTLQMDSWADHMLFPKYSNIHWADPVLLEPIGHPRNKHYSTLSSNGTPDKFLLPHIFELWKIFPPPSSLSFRVYVVRAVKAPQTLVALTTHIWAKATVEVETGITAASLGQRVEMEHREAAQGQWIL